MLWFFYAVAASVLWGVSYAVLDELLKKISVASIFLYSSFASIAFGLVLGLSKRTLGADWQLLKEGGRETKLMLASIGVSLAANLFILLSINAKNATMAAMIEITYPLFTALFAWMFFREVQVTAGTLIGALLILSGVACIYYFGKTI